MFQKYFTTITVIAAFCVLGCATPVGVKTVSPRDSYAILTTNAMSGDRTSVHSSQLLARLGLADRFEKEPQNVLAELRTGLDGPDNSDRLFALAELSFLHASQNKDPSYFMASAIYSYQFLFPDDQDNDPQPYDPRLRMAMDLYNRAIANALRVPKGREFNLGYGQIKLPFGEVELSSDPEDFKYGRLELTNFISLDNLEIYGLRNHYRMPGIGAPFAAGVRPIAGETASPRIGPQFKVPVTIFIRFNPISQSSNKEKMTGRIEVYNVDTSPAIEIGGRSVPLESDPSAALAYRLDNSPVWDFEIAGFRRGDLNPFNKDAEGALYFLSPYHPDRIPIVFVHGTASSPARWAEMANELLSDPIISSRYQLWFLCTTAEFRLHFHPCIYARACKML